MERKLAEMTGSLEKLAGAEEEEEEEEEGSGSSVHRCHLRFMAQRTVNWKRRRRRRRGAGLRFIDVIFGSWLRELFARVLVARVVFIEGARAFKHKKCILEKKVLAAIGVWEGVRCVGGVEVCGRCDGRVRCVGVVKVCGTVLEMGQ